MSEPPVQGLTDQVQIYSVAQAGRRLTSDLADSPNSTISVLRLAPGEQTELVAQGSDRILVVLRGEGTVTTPESERPLATQQGMLIPPGLSCRLENTSQAELVVYSMQTRRPEALVANVASDVHVRVPIELMNAKGIGSRIYAYVMDRATIGLSPLIMEEWNKVSAVRMNCKYERIGDEVVATLPARVVQWYGIEELAEGDYRLRSDRTRTRVRVDITPFIERKAQGVAGSP
jgi:mannose-6-phosphate isomerase-like protein (cupin superfamily)